MTKGLQLQNCNPHDHPGAFRLGEFIKHSPITMTQPMFIFCCSVREFMDFTSKIIVERTDVAQRASVKEQGT